MNMNNGHDHSHELLAIDPRDSLDIELAQMCRQVFDGAYATTYTGYDKADRIRFIETHYPEAFQRFGRPAIEAAARCANLPRFGPGAVDRWHYAELRARHLGCKPPTFSVGVRVLLGEPSDAYQRRVRAQLTARVDAARSTPKPMTITTHSPGALTTVTKAVSPPAAQAAAQAAAKPRATTLMASALASTMASATATGPRLLGTSGYINTTGSPFGPFRRVSGDA